MRFAGSPGRRVDYVIDEAKPPSWVVHLVATFSKPGSLISPPDHPHTSPDGIALEIPEVAGHAMTSGALGCENHSCSAREPGTAWELL